MLKSTWTALGAVFFASLATAATAQERWYIAPDVTYTLPDTKRYEGHDTSLGISFGRGFNDRFDLELGYTANHLSLKDRGGSADRKSLLLNSLFKLNDDYEGLYGSLGAGLIRQDFNGSVDLLPMATVGLGYKVTIPFAPRFDLQPEIRAQYVHDQSSPSSKDELNGQALLRLRYNTAPRAEQSASPTTPAPAQASDVQPRASSTTDLCRGVSKRSEAYARNQCQKTEDRDVDGVPDHLDLCPNTIPGVKVDPDGCIRSR